jgi:hypothetical protein
MRLLAVVATLGLALAAGAPSPAAMGTGAGGASDPASSALLPKVLAVALGLVAASLAARRLAAQTRRRQPQVPADPGGVPPAGASPDPAASRRR